MMFVKDDDAMRGECGCEQGAAGGCRSAAQMADRDGVNLELYYTPWEGNLWSSLNESSTAC